MYSFHIHTIERHISFGGEIVLLQLHIFMDYTTLALLGS